MNRARKVIVFILSFIYICSCFFENMLFVKASNINERENAIIFTEKVEDVIGVPGEKVHVKLPVRADSYINNPKISVEAENMPFTVEDIKLSEAGMENSNGISNLVTTYIEFDLNIKQTAKICNKEILVKVEYTDQYSSDLSVEKHVLYLPAFNFIIVDEKDPPKLTIDNVSLEDAFVGNDTELSFTIKNEGEITSYKTTLQVEGYETAGLTPNYSKIQQEVGIEGKINPGESYQIILPVSISSKASPGTKTLKIISNYTDMDGIKNSSETKIYINIGENNNAPNIEIESTKYAGELNQGNQFNLITTLRNIGVLDAENIEVSVKGLGINSFIPIYTSNIISAGTLEQDEKTDVKIPLIVSKEANPGLKEITLKVNYQDASGTIYTKTSKLYLEIMNTNETPDNIPKLIVDNYTTDVEELRAGNSFYLIFDILNTHSSLGVKNVRITLSQPNNIFTTAEDGKTLQISELLPGKKAKKLIKLDINSDAITNVYPLEVKMEYEYDGDEELTDKNVYTLTEIINLPVVEDSIPVIENIRFQNDIQPTINQPTKLSFDFYNMGKSTLSNVTASIVGDYNLASGNNYYVGNVASSKSEHIELDVIPTLDGLAKGILIISYKDNTGEEFKITKEFESTIQKDSNQGNKDKVNQTNSTQGLFNIYNLPKWVWIVLEIVVIVMVIFITRKVLRAMDRRKNRKSKR